VRGGRRERKGRAGEGRREGRLRVGGLGGKGERNR